MENSTLDKNQYHALARQVAAEACVLLKNDGGALPLQKGQRVSVFGRIAWNYYKSGTGSGGLVNTWYVTGILDALRSCADVQVNEELAGIYEAWISEHPFDAGNGWGTEPWCQEEMPLSEELVSKAAACSDCAIFLIGRTAGEDRDASADEGSFLLTRTEYDALEKVCRAFPKTIVLLNVGNIIDMGWVEELNPSAVMYVWQGGQEGGNGVLDVLTGRENPSGHLTDTIARTISDYPAMKNFGHPHRNLYEEDIYVGYRYFETFAPNRVLYPFGFGLSYTSFALSVEKAALTDSCINVSLYIRNTGSTAGKAVPQLYVRKPQGKLGNPAQQLIAYRKTPLLEPGEELSINYRIPLDALASYDDSGATGHKSCFVLEAGQYVISCGENVRDLAPVFEFTISELKVVEQLNEACSPTVSFRRMKPLLQGDRFEVTYEDVPLRSYDLTERIASRDVSSVPYSGDKGYQLKDVSLGRISLDAFLAQLTDVELICLVRGEGMSSPKATPGTAAAIGGITPALAHYGIPIGCFSDGPSGIRMDCGTKATSLPIGTALGCTFNDELIRSLYFCLGQELRSFRIDSLLGPGINIHRCPLNGRNFEYISEDPYLSGTVACAQLQGMAQAGVTGTIKHMAANNQEYLRKENDSVLSERALREIYLSAFEIAVKHGGAYSIMTSYNAVNGIWTAGNYDLVAEILRRQWGYDGLVMTDWWASINEEGEAPSATRTDLMVRSGNDIFMVVEDSLSNSLHDVSAEGLQAGIVSRADYLHAARHICDFLLKSPALGR